MPIDATIPLNSKAPDTMQTLGSLMNVANGMNQFQIGRQNIQGGQIKLDQAVQANKERLALQDFTSNPENWQTDGKIDMSKINAAVPKIAPYTGSDYISKLSTLSTAQTQASSARQALTQDQRSIVAGPLGVLGRAGVTDPKVYATELDNLKTQNPDNKDLHKLIDAYKTTIGHMPGGDAPAKWAIVASQGLMKPTEQQASLSPTVGLTNTGDRLVPTVTQPAVAGNQPTITASPNEAIPMHIAPGQQQTVTTTPSGDLGVINRAPTGQIIGASEVPGGGGAGSNRFSFPPGESKATRDAIDTEIAAARTSANQAPVLHEINRTIMSEASGNFATGKLGELSQRLASATGYKLSGNDATNYNVLGKMLEQSAIRSAQSMGPQTNAGLEAAIRANGSLEYTPAALRKIAAFNDAIVSASELYRDGLNTAVQNGGPFAKREFDKQWSQVATPQALRFKNAVDNNNQEEIGSVLKEVGGRGSAGARKLGMQIQAIHKLAGR